MSNRKINEIVYEIALPIIEKHNFELVDVEFLKEGKNWYLRAYIDKPGGVNIDDCQTISHELSDELDKKDPVKQSYILEVSSPGLDRPLKKDRDFDKYRGQEIEVKIYKPIDGKKIFTGELLGLADNMIEIRTGEGDVLSFERETVSLVRRVIKI